MKTITKYAAAATLTGALALAAATPSQARDWPPRRWRRCRLRRRRAGWRGRGQWLTANNGYYYGDRVTLTRRVYAYDTTATPTTPAPAYYGPAPRYYRARLTAAATAAAEHRRLPPTLRRLLTNRSRR